MTQSQLDRLIEAYSSGILKIREGDTWVEYQSMKEMRIAIEEAKRQLNNVTPKGSRLLQVSKGY